jgi:uncharacterized repeat protein (TIGR03803 family)
MKSTKWLLIVLLLFLSTKIFAQNPQLWGMTYQGGTNTEGNIFNINGDSTGFSSVYSFITLTGHGPCSSLLQAKDGKLYGTAGYGGSHSAGVIFRFNPFTYVYTDLFDFDSANGSSPQGKLIQASNDKLYGMTPTGGDSNYGVLFSFDLSNNNYTKILDFIGSNGSHPLGSLMQANNGKIYGMTTYGGIDSAGVIFSYNPSSNVFTKLFDFNDTLGNGPGRGLIQANDGKLYGLTTGGGINRNGVLFSFNPSNNVYTKLYDFNIATGSTPYGGLIQATDGILYGMTYDGDSCGPGVLFNFDLSNNTYHKLFGLFCAIDGEWPHGSLIQAKNGKLYGMTSDGGNPYCGIIFSFELPNTINKLHEFGGGFVTGCTPYGELIELDTTLSAISEINGIDNRINIYPNPTTGFINISLDKNINGGQLTIFNVLGESVYSDAFNGKLKTVNCNFSSGVYFVIVKTENGFIANRFVKQ